MFRLRIVPAHGDPFEHQLEGESVVIGRSSSADLALADRFLSRRHARLFNEGELWFAEDLGSRNGTLVNGTAIQEPTRLQPGDELRLSGSVISILTEDGKTKSTTASSDLGTHTVFRKASELIESQTTSATAGLQAPEEVRRQTERLKMLNDVHRALARSIDLSELLQMILVRAFDHLEPEEGAIFLKKDENGGYNRAAARSVAGIESDYLYSETLVNEVAEKGLAALVLDVETDERFAAAESILSSGVRSLVAAPLLDAEGALGMIVLNSRVHKRQFNEEDMELLVSLASVAAMRIRNVALAVEAAERRRMEEELKLARQIQVTLLPSQLPEVDGYEIRGGNIPSRGVSGDYYRVVDRNDGAECLFIIADVSGKGIAASLLTASLEALMAGPIEVGQPAEEICSKVCRRLFARTPPAKYATSFLAVLEPKTGEITYTNAGHNPALIVRADGKVEELGPTGLPIGLMEDGNYTEGKTKLGPGDLLVLYTDGITEATDPEDEEYGLERLTAVCKKHRKKPLDELANEIDADLDGFAQGVPYADDRTLVMARRTKK
ncbi:MAG: FHA domain-containing protein [Acidobacteria bacterium]|nr:MAG: FHA domain-containing protein [Acidobacteriota bacterium]